MDRALGNLLARVFGALALSAFFVHVGMHLQRDAPQGASAAAWAFVALLLVAGVAGAWAQARLNAKRAALWASLVINGLVPVAAFSIHATRLDGTPFFVVLVIGAAFGVLTTVATAVLLASKNAG